MERYRLQKGICAQWHSEQPAVEVSDPESVETRTAVAAENAADPPELAICEPAASAQEEEPEYDCRVSVPGTRRRRSKLDPFRELVGVVPDSVVAERAGVTNAAVVAYRRRCGIPAAASKGGRGRNDTAGAAVIAEIPDPDAPLPTAYRVAVTDGDGPLEYITVAHDVSSAVAKALVGLRLRHPEARISEITRLGPVLS